MGLQGSAHVQYPLVAGLEVILPTMFGLMELGAIQCKDLLELLYLGNVRAEERHFQFTLTLFIPTLTPLTD